jgi:predicted enzyme related to lactoylglutathione lyase
MTTEDRAQHGSPCWTDLWTSDVDGSRRFYAELFGWSADEPDPTHGGYFMFTRDGAPVAGGMGGMGDATPSDSWKIYLAADDIESSLTQAQSDGAQIVVEAMPVDELGVQSVLVDPTGAELGVWQQGTFSGFSALDEPGTPSWFELHTRDFDRAISFYRSVFGWETVPLEGNPDMRYSTVRLPGQTTDIAGILDISSVPDGEGSRWHTYWKVDDIDAVASRVTELGGSVVEAPTDTPYGRLATVSDPAGAVFKLRQ